MNIEANSPLPTEKIESHIAEMYRRTIKSEIRSAGFFPVAEVSREEEIVALPAIIVSFGYPISQYLPVPDDAIILTPKGLFQADCVKAAAQNKRYFSTLPAMETLRPATETDYITHGKKALLLLADARKRYELKLDDTYNLEGSSVHRDFANLHRRLVDRGPKNPENWYRAVLPVPKAEVSSWFTRFSDLGLKRLIEKEHAPLGVRDPFITELRAIHITAEDRNSRKLLIIDFIHYINDSMPAAEGLQTSPYYSQRINVVYVSETSMPAIISSIYEYLHTGIGPNDTVVHDFNHRREYLTVEEFKALYQYLSGAEGLEGNVAQRAE